MRVPLSLAAEACSVPVRTLRRWAEQGRLTAEHDGRRWLVDLDEVAQLDELRDSRNGRLDGRPGVAA